MEAYWPYVNETNNGDRELKFTYDKSLIWLGEDDLFHDGRISFAIDKHL